MNAPSQEALKRIKEYVIYGVKAGNDAPYKDDYWWCAIHYLWSDYDFMHPGKTITERALYSALVDMNVPRNRIVKRDNRTVVNLKNISFVYWSHRYPNGVEALVVTPHRRGFKFNQCDHDYFEPSGYVYELAIHMLDLDRWIPQIRETAWQAYQEGLQEKRIRDIKCRIAGAFLEEYFQGELPDAIEELEVTDSPRGEMDTIQLKIHDDDCPFWDRPTIDLPFNFREILQQDAIREFTEDLGLTIGCSEMYKG